MSGVSADTIRHYEKIGLIPKPVRTQAGYRLYPAEASARVQVIRSALRAGFSLSELTQVFKKRDAGVAPCRQVADLAAQKVTLLQERIVELTDLREWLLKVLEEWNRMLCETPPGKPARLLEFLTQMEPSWITKGRCNESRRDLSNALHSAKNRRTERLSFARNSIGSKHG